jgi:hypothetical protein
MVLGAGRTPLQVLAHPRDAGVSLGSLKFQLDVAIELCEAFLTAQLKPLRPEHPPEQTAIAWISGFAHELGAVISRS